MIVRGVNDETNVNEAIYENVKAGINKKNYKSIEYLTVEYYRDIENLEASLKRVKELV